MPSNGAETVYTPPPAGPDAWAVGPETPAGPGLPHLFAFAALIAVGTVVGTLGTIGMPMGLNVSAFWPAMTLQAVGGMWFGAWGVLGGVVFALLSNCLTSGSAANIWGFIPSNILQSGLAVLCFRHWSMAPWLPTRREVVFFIGAGALLPNVLGAAAGIAALAFAGEIRTAPHAGTLFFSWVAGNTIPCLLLGIPLLKFATPLVYDSPFFCRRWWGGSRRVSWTGMRIKDWPVAARLLLALGIAGVLPILAVSVVDLVLAPPSGRGPWDLVFPVMLNLSIFLSLIVSGLISGRIARRVGALRQGAKRFGAGDLHYRVEVTGNDEFGQLAQTLNRMAQDLVVSRDALRCKTAEQERYKKELEIAHTIQKSFLPQAFPEITGFDCAACNLPARSVGGDFYDFIPLPGKRWGLVVADVSDKGVPAALFMALSRSLIRAYSMKYETVREALAAFNAYAEAENASGMFVTVFYAILDPSTGLLTYINAGHDPPLLIRGRSQQTLFLKTAGIPLGIMPETSLTENRFQLERGDVVVLYTDGVTDAQDVSGEMFGVERLVQSVRARLTDSAAGAMQGVLDDISRYAGQTDQFDDITLLVLRYL